MPAWRVTIAVPLFLAACSAPPPTSPASGREPVVRAIGKIPTSETAAWKSFTAATGQYPPMIWYYALAYNPPTGKTYVFGGQSSKSNALNDFWMWDGEAWSQIVAATSPPARQGAALAYDPARKSLILYGGTNPDDIGNNLVDTWEWTEAKGWPIHRPQWPVVPV